MSKNLERLVWFILLTLILVSSVILSWPDENVHIVFCDVGQGDAVLITHRFDQILVDAGPSSSKVNKCLEENVPFWDRKIELIIETHADKDHIGGFESVLDGFFVEKLMLNEWGKKTDVFNDFRDAVQRELVQGADLILWQKGDQIAMGDKIKLINLTTRGDGDGFFIFENEIPETKLWDLLEDQEVLLESENYDHNSLSIVQLLVVGEVQILLTGDMEAEGEQALIEENLIADIDVLKVGHHGSKNATSDLFLQNAQPEIAVISVSQKNNYGHPSQVVLDNLRKVEAKILRTDELGSVELVTNGVKIWLK